MEISLIPACYPNENIVDSRQAFLGEILGERRNERKNTDRKICFGPPLKGQKIIPELLTPYPADVREEANTENAPLIRTETMPPLSHQSLL